MLMSTALALAMSAPPALAGSCDTLIAKADRVPTEQLPDLLSRAIACDPVEAAKNFTRFMTRATDSETLVGLSLAAIDGQVWNPVWVMPAKITDYNVRDVIAGQIGEACADNSQIVLFLQGAYGALRGLDFQQWDDAFLACDDPVLIGWIEQQLQAPPTSTYDEKYDLLLGIYVEKKGREALPVLQSAAVAAAAAGPFEAILMKMDEAVAPSLGQTMAAEDHAALEEALVAIAQQVEPAKARAVAERLVASGSEAAAAGLLTYVYPDRHEDGVFTWGGFSVERAECKGVQTAVLHVAEITEPGERWIVTDEVIEPLRAAKIRLKKCTPEEGDWPIVTSTEPLHPGTVDEWARQEAGKWMTNGYEVELHKEKPISLD